MITSKKLPVFLLFYSTALFVNISARQIHKGGGNVRKREYSRGRTVRQDSSSQNFESLGPPSPVGVEYYLSKSKTGRDEALQACSVFSSSNSQKKFRLVDLDSTEEVAYIKGKLGEKGTDCVWAAANMFTDDAQQKRLVTIDSTKGKKTVDFTGGLQTTKREVTKSQETVTVKDTIFPLYEASSGGCNVAPKCPESEIQCTVTTPNCKPDHGGCVIEDDSPTCKIVPTGNCVASSSNCTVVNPKCALKHEPCQVSQRTCQILPPVCKVIKPKCEVTRPPCITVQPPCDKVEDPATHPDCQQPKPCIKHHEAELNCTFETFCKLVDGKTVCTKIITQACFLNDVCLEPTICFKNAVLCPSPQTICPPAIVKCGSKVECEQPRIVCDEPKVTCPDPKLLCENPVINCGAPIIKCPPVVATCPNPKKLNCPPSAPCKPPTINCNKRAKVCEIETQPEATKECPDSMKCNENCQCVKLSNSNGYQLTPTSCTDQCYALCKG